MPSVVIAAHNEEYVIGLTLEALLQDGQANDLQIIVSANGCTDGTVRVATRTGVTVIDRAEPGKAGALNAGDEAATTYPRVYLDADIVVPPGGIAQLVALIDTPRAPLAVVPSRRLNTAGSPWPVRAYFAINERLPAFRDGLFGRGLIALSEEGRSRFDTFPLMIADDLFLDSQFTAEEKAEAEHVVVVVEAPRTSRDLLRRLVRVRRGNAEMRAASQQGEVAVAIRPSDRWAWLRDVVVPEPRLAPAAIPYLGFTVLAALLARRSPDGKEAWGRDESTRSGPRAEGEA